MEFNKYFDHTILNADAKKSDVQKICDEARKYDFASVCVNSYWAKFVSDNLRGTNVRTCCVVGFPLGAMSTISKAFEARCAVEDGADEIDMVINVGEAKDHNYDNVRDDIKIVRENCAGKVLKVIIETCLLTDEEKVKVCEMACEAGADFVKTSTGFSTGGATVEDVALMRTTVDEYCQKNDIERVSVKASGGIRDRKTADAMIEAGADRLGTSKTIEINK